MATLRFLLPEPHEVPLLGRVLEPDEAVEVDDDVFKEHAWPESTWAVVDGPKGRKSKTAGDSGDNE